MPAKPRSIIAHVEGSGTAFGMSVIVTLLIVLVARMSTEQQLNPSNCDGTGLGLVALNIPDSEVGFGKKFSANVKLVLPPIGVKSVT